MNKTRLKVVLIGFGRMGKNHFRVINSDSRFELVGVIDTQVESLAEVSSKFNVCTSNQLSTLSSLDWECAVVASPTESHYEILKSLIEFGKPILVEKPLAPTLEQCESIISLASRKKVFVGVGHLERFNPAVLKLKELLKSGWIGEPIHFSITRVGGYPAFVKPGNNVLLNLAVHDLDVLSFLVGPQKIRSSICHSTWKEGVLDTAEILSSTLDNKISASLHVNWVTPTKIRAIRLTGTKGVVFADYILQSVTLMGGSLLQWAPVQELDFQKLVESYQFTDRVEFGILKEEPLKVQLNQFYSAIVNNQTTICTIHEAMNAVKLANEAIKIGVINS